MARRPEFRRGSSEIKRGRIGIWPTDKPDQAKVAKRARYVPSGEHKGYPSKAGAWVFGPKKSRTLCLKYSDESFLKIHKGIAIALAGPCISEEFRGDFPARAWVWVDDVLHELRLTSETAGEYHGFPINYSEDFPEDPLGRMKDCPHVKVIQD